VCAIAAGQPAEEFGPDLLWRFRLDPEDAGWREAWQALTLAQTEAWERIRTDDCWEKQAEGGHLREAARERIKTYDGISWYATRLDIPSRLKGRPLFLRFGAVDESAWVYVNGHLAGQHVFVRQDDWKKPFDIRADPFVDWARPAQHVVVRVEDRDGLGGIWKRVRLIAPATGSLQLPAVLGNHMVLQTGIAVPIWGTALPNEGVRVLFRGQEKTTRADAQGNWRLTLEPMLAGGPDTMRVIGADGAGQRLEDVLVGEVWVGAGQSNMERTCSRFQKDDELRRLIQGAPYPKLRVFHEQRWQVSSTNSLSAFSALMTAFGIPLHRELNTPVGLLVGARGGTPSAVWVPEADYRNDPACRQAAADFARGYNLELARERHARLMAGWDQRVAEAGKAGKPEPRKPYAPVPAGECYRGKIGELFEEEIRPFIPHAIRGVLWDQGEGGTCITGVDQFTVMSALIAGWRRQWGQGDFPFLFVQKPSGGGCAYDPDAPMHLFAGAFATLPAAMPTTADGLYRDTYVRLAQQTNALMVTVTDLVGGGHPPLKSAYGARAARVALGGVYGKPVAVCGPVFRKSVCEGGRIRIFYSHLGKGLTVRYGEKPQGFAVAGPDRVFSWADAAIDGDTVVVSSPNVPEPVAVRYAWGKTHPWANLFNRDGLPALAFRTDIW
jgi:sialate O-acetylesterase